MERVRTFNASKSSIVIMSKTAVLVIYIAIIIYQGQMLSAYKKPFFQGTRYGPFIGPFALKKVRPKNGWKSLRLTEVDFSSAKMVVFCSEEKMNGVCNQILPPTRVGQVMVRTYCIKIFI